MKNILIIGSGRSSTVLLEYLLNEGASKDFFITVLDQYENDFLNQFISFSNLKTIFFDINKDKLRTSQIKQSDLVISMLPPRFHVLIAKDCIKHKKNLITASYVSEAMKELEKQAIEANILILK